MVEHAVELAEARQRVDRSRIEMVRGYAETDACRRQFLLGYFGEDLPEPCGNCDNCADGSAYEEDYDDGAAAAAGGEAFPAPGRRGAQGMGRRAWSCGTRRT